jgi:hypothetical protein
MVLLLVVMHDSNGSGDTYVGWNWLANGAGVANTDGSISSTVSASYYKWI